MKFYKLVRLYRGGLRPPSSAGFHRMKKPFEVGKWRVVRGLVVPCWNGFHALSTMRSLKYWYREYRYRSYQAAPVRIYECELGKVQIKHDKGYPSEKIVSNKIRLTIRRPDLEDKCKRR